MLVREKDTQIATLASLPAILSLNKHGEPIGWIDYETSAIHYANNKVLYSLGTYEVVLNGGINAKTGLQSKLMLDTIIAVNSSKSPLNYRRSAPALTNNALFERDRYLCAYCGDTFKRKELTREHIIPRSKGGVDTWENVVAACKPCNSRKDDLTLEQAGVELLYIPYTPNYYENLILSNKKILSDQMAFLMQGVHKNSRLRMS